MDYSQWTLRQKIGQLIVVRASGFLFDHQIRYPQWEAPNERLKAWLSTLNLGGVILLGGSAVELAQRTQQLQGWATTPLLLCADIEEGVGQRFTGATWFPPPMALGDIAKQDLTLACDYARRMGEVTAQEALAIGLNWVLAPIADVNNNPENPVINVRAFGETPEIVRALVQAFIAGAKSYPVLTTAKHFPGHGDTATDSHLHLPVIPHSAERLAQVELPPFQGAIAAGVDTVMTAHLQIPVWDDQHPATLSPGILTGQLREKLGFEGLIVTDALIMGGITQGTTPEEVAIRALEAGADILLMPPDPVQAIDAIAQAVTTGRLTTARIDQSLQKIYQAKSHLSLLGQPPAPMALEQLSLPTARATVQAILQTSLKTGGNLPLPVTTTASQNSFTNLIIVDDLLNSDFLDRACPSVKIPRDRGYQVQLVDQNSLGLLPLPSHPTLLQGVVRGNPFRGIAGLTPEAQTFYQAWLKHPLLQGLMLYGSPYVLGWFLPQFSADFPWVFSFGQMPQAQAIACQTLFGLAEDVPQVKEAFTN
ncbi:MAG: glycoside hydrolase family 3 N-terminal domain-containing protein [Microcystaceae cyanobacterium]